MRLNQFKIKNFLLWSIISFATALLTGWGLFESITKHIFSQSVTMSIFFAFSTQLSFKTKNKIL